MDLVCVNPSSSSRVSVGDCFFWYQLTWAVPDKGPFDSCVFVGGMLIIFGGRPDSAHSGCKPWKSGQSQCIIISCSEVSWSCDIVTVQPNSPTWAQSHINICRGWDKNHEKCTVYRSARCCNRYCCSSGFVCACKQTVLFGFRGKLRDTVLDWEDALPPSQLDNAEKLCRLVQLTVQLT